MKHVVGAAIAIYCVAYLALRFSTVEVWAEDGEAYVHFPTEPLAVYYVFRPLAYVDGALTGMRFHIGPHAE